MIIGSVVIMVAIFLLYIAMMAFMGGAFVAFPNNVYLALARPEDGETPEQTEEENPVPETDLGLT